MNGSDEISSGVYVLDANVFMNAFRDSYHPDVFPGFWEWLEQCLNARTIISIDRVFAEIKSPPLLVEWARNISRESFASSADEQVVAVYSQIQTWVNNAANFLPAAKNKFAQGADAWIVAFAYAHGGTVVTQEVFDPNVRRRVPMPNVCKEFGVEYQNTIQMLSDIHPRFVLDPSQRATESHNG